MHRFKEIYFEALEPNPEMIDLMRELKESGYRMAMLTNNVREWEPLWRSMLPVDEIFETVVDSGFVGCRKPESKIYAMTLERIGMAPEACLFVDDVEVNCEGAQRAGINAVHFRDNEQAIPEIRAALAVAQTAQVGGSAGTSADPRRPTEDPEMCGLASFRSRRGPRCRARPPRRRAPSGAAARAGRGPARARRPR